MWGGMVRLERGVSYALPYVLPYVLLYVLLYVLPAGNVVGSCDGRTEQHFQPDGPPTL